MQDASVSGLPLMDGHPARWLIPDDIIVLAVAIKLDHFLLVLLLLTDVDVPDEESLELVHLLHPQAVYVLCLYLQLCLLTATHSLSLQALLRTACGIHALRTLGNLGLGEAFFDFLGGLVGFIEIGVGIEALLRIEPTVELLVGLCDLL